jgi:uncharacterized protein YegP (UPF0339 family)
MKSKKLSPLPPFASDQDAEAFVEHADLTQFDLSTGGMMTFERTNAKQATTDDYTFIVLQDGKDRFRFDVKASSGRVLFSSEPLETRGAALKAIQTFKAAILAASTRDASDAAA